MRKEIFIDANNAIGLAQSHVYKEGIVGRPQILISQTMLINKLSPEQFIPRPTNKGLKGF